MVIEIVMISMRARKLDEMTVTSQPLNPSTPTMTKPA
jgi:hypothetical protein